ncbi:glucose-1-phosphate thymidylyltransferase [Shewanella algicola]|uniref:Glucose-1-phosphate thymidylyltransferase n=1 Tax=Shewanella algicola TaxID=640633 RepID=A0A9X2CDR1_9GAMM|nr:glucose-1-phosphate thymidylyltransferase RfbA [Shewanella algicola]MCL1105731.1 glucose-1-phosphate thymidylyltransferase RfbA [Shewanella algicola]GGP54078.1 glucose-1-phosphate thymidylyltransferase [Shewanella algicola]
MRKGILLAGGSGTRLYPITQVVCKQLLPIYDKPMIYYPLCTLMQAGITEVLVICTPTDRPLFESLLGNGHQWGIKIEFAIQAKPEGLAQALIIAEPFLNGSPSALILGDNLFYGHLLQSTLQLANNSTGATVFGYHVANPQSYGVIEFDDNNNAIAITEKPTAPKSSYAMPGLYFFDSNASNYAKQVKPSERGELEIVDVINQYLANKILNVTLLSRGTAWLDTGTPDAMAEATQYIAAIEKRQGLKVSCPEEVAYLSGLIDQKQLVDLATPLLKSGYGEYLLSLINKNFLNEIH